MPITLNEVPQQTINQDTDALSRVVPNTGRNDVVQKLAAWKQINSGAHTLRFPSDLGKYYMRIQLADYKRASATSLTFTPTATIVLPMTAQLADTNQVRYEEGSLGPLGGEIADATLKYLNNVAKSMNNTQFSISGLQKILTATVGADFSGQGSLRQTDGTGIRDAGLLTAGRFVNDVITSASDGTIKIPLDEAIGFAGFAVNQFFVVLMKGPTYKEYTFHWRLMPRNAGESDTIRNIITTLNNAAAVGLTESKLFWKFPQVARLSFVPNSSYLFKFKPAVIESIQANYAPQGSAAFYHSTGAPEAVDLTIVFKEMEYWLTGDFSNGDDPGASTLDTSGAGLAG
jgi:hypothetical protein